MARTVTKKIKITTQRQFGSRVRDVETTKTIKGLRFAGKTAVTLFGLPKPR